MVMLRSLALMVVQRQRAASKSTNPPRTGQHASFALLPIPMWISPPNTSTHASSFSVGHVPCPSAGGGGGGGGHGVSGAGGVTTGGSGNCGGGLGSTGGCTMGGSGSWGGGLGMTGG